MTWLGAIKLSIPVKMSICACVERGAASVAVSVVQSMSWLNVLFVAHALVSIDFVKVY